MTSDLAKRRFHELLDDVQWGDTMETVTPNLDGSRTSTVTGPVLCDQPYVGIDLLNGSVVEVRRHRQYTAVPARATLYRGGVVLRTFDADDDPSDELATSDDEPLDEPALADPSFEYAVMYRGGHSTAQLLTIIGGVTFATADEARALLEGMPKLWGCAAVVALRQVASEWTEVAA